MANTNEKKHMSIEEVVEGLSNKIDAIKGDPNLVDDANLFEEAARYVEVCDQILRYLKHKHIQAKREMNFENEQIMGVVLRKIETFL